jgi:hypothetical protein
MRAMARRDSAISRGFGRAAAIALLALAAGCGSPALLTKRDYAPATQALSQGRVDDARASIMPLGERGGFITTMEKTYLALLEGRPEIDDLARFAKVIEDQLRYKVSREARTFFYVQTPEDYYAGEHEIIWMHMLLSWGYSLRGKYEDACVEARNADNLLELPWSPVGRFDDPAMRLFVAGLWTMCGDWKEARVDLRAAARLDPSLGWTKELSERETPPQHLFIALGGIGAEPYWDPQWSVQPLRGGRKIGFRLRGLKSSLDIVDAHGLLFHSQRSPDATPWYERHLARNNEIQDLIEDSHYAKDVVTEGSVATIKIGAYTAIGLAWGIGGTVIGGAIAYAGAQNGGNADAVRLGLTIIAAGWAKGWEVMSRGTRESTQEFKQQVDPSTGYRLVRFLPDYLWLAWSDRPVSYPVEARTPREAKLALPNVLNRGAAVSIVFVPDVRAIDGSRRGGTGY